MITAWAWIVALKVSCEERESGVVGDGRMTRSVESVMVEKMAVFIFLIFLFEICGFV